MNRRSIAKDSFTALLINYLTTGSRDTIEFSINQTKVLQVNGRLIKVDRKSFGEDPEIPGVNIVFTDEFTDGPNTNPGFVKIITTVIIYVNKTSNAVADDIVATELQRKVDEALADFKSPLIDLSSGVGVQVGRNIHWFRTKRSIFWRDATNLELFGYIKKSKVIEVLFEDTKVV